MWNWAHWEHHWIDTYFTVGNGDDLKFIVRLCRENFCGKTDVDVSEMYDEGSNDHTREDVPSLIAKAHRRNVEKKEERLERGEYVKHWNDFKLPNAVRQTAFCTECGGNA